MLLIWSDKIMMTCLGLLGAEALGFNLWNMQLTKNCKILISSDLNLMLRVRREGHEKCY